jgi:protein tyrosine phosphatase
MNDFKTGGYCPTCLHATSGCTCMKDFWNIVGNNEIKKVFKIHVGDISEDEKEETIKKWNSVGLLEGLTASFDENIARVFDFNKRQIIMDERLKNVNLLDELRETMEDVEIQLFDDEKRYGDTWKERGLVYNGMNQETRWFYKMQDYFQNFMDSGEPIPWTKVIGEAHIALVREKKLK